MKMDQVPIRWDRGRGCGTRKPGGLYFVGGEPTACEKLPVPLCTCPTCGEGLRHSRGWKWIIPDQLLQPGPHTDHEHTLTCPIGGLGRMGERAGLLWVGKQFYDTPDNFMSEWATQGISRRIRHIPHGFKLGETWILLAHIAGIQTVVIEHYKKIVRHTPACIAVFMPRAIEYVCRGDETEAELDGLVEKGITPVRVRPESQRQPLFE